MQYPHYFCFVILFPSIEKIIKNIAIAILDNYIFLIITFVIETYLYNYVFHTVSSVTITIFFLKGPCIDDS